MTVTEVLVPGGFGRALRAPGGSKITIVDLHGQQAGDFVALSASDLTDGISGVGTKRADGGVDDREWFVFGSTGYALRDFVHGASAKDCSSKEPTSVVILISIDDQFVLTNLCPDDAL